MIFNNSIENPIVGVFLGGKTLKAGRVFQEEIVAKYEKIIDNKGSEEEVLQELYKAIDEVITKDTIAIGIGVPSIVDVERGIVYKVFNIPSWIEVHLKNIVEQRYNVKVLINNDANCFAIGEKYFGSAKNQKNVIGLIMDSGIGAGVIINNKLYSGTNCGAGEFGYVPYKDFNYEYYCTIKYFEEKFGIKNNVLFERAEKNDKIALAIYEQFGFDVGNAIKTLMYTYDPEVIVIGGVVSEAFKFYKKSITKSLRTFAYPDSAKRIVVKATENPDIAILGAAALYLDENNIYL